MVVFFCVSLENSEAQGPQGANMAIKKHCVNQKTTTVQMDRVCLCVFVPAIVLRTGVTFLLVLTSKEDCTDLTFLADMLIRLLAESLIPLSCLYAECKAGKPGDGWFSLAQDSEKGVVLQGMTCIELLAQFHTEKIHDSG